VAQQQCCGPLQLPVADVAVMAQSHQGLTGAATSIGEQPLKGLVGPAAMARMALGEAVTNLVWAAATSLADVKASVNWMCGPFRPASVLYSLPAVRLALSLSAEKLLCGGSVALY
jgi:phosphoribosylformylglycinamidine (FGAM) synthase-like enzyme